MEFNTLPLPPNWETRFDVELQRWFFVDHANKSTSWEDPRPAYYAAHPPDTISPSQKTPVEGVGRTVKQSENSAYHMQSSITSDSAYCVIDSEPEQPLSSSLPKEESVEKTEDKEDDAQTEMFATYWEALRAAYPQYKERQYLGESDALKKFVSRYVRRKQSGASGRRGKQTTSSSSRQNSGSNYKKEYVPYVVEMQAEAARDSRPNHRHTVSQPWKYDSNVQLKDHDGLTTGTSRSLSVRESVLKDITKTGTDKFTRPDATALSSTCSSPGPQQSTYFLPGRTKSPVATTQVTSPVSAGADQTKMAVANILPVTSTSHLVTRCTPRGQDPSLRVSRVQACGPDAGLVRGPDPSLVRGASSRRSGAL
ncbi:hypothetical protein EG68_11167 [Paragonimus skrjabini miyazakii]|uniref:WW domain-containing protein n=1 Tax=Paragonimus skrjabini miyazakii TaxID=59628 RepID=A0A8S9YQY2_9TREM|nr:hypothetical protein EG68_11167 [Paragonimus skrjabini miyazakii]